MKTTQKLKRLSTNEKEVLNLMAQGYKNREIAKIMRSKDGNPLSEKTVSTYILRIKMKLCATLDINTYFLVQKAINLNIIEIPEQMKKVGIKIINEELYIDKVFGINTSRLTSKGRNEKGRHLGFEGILSIKHNGSKEWIARAGDFGPYDYADELGFILIVE